MGFRKTLTSSVLVMGLILALSAWAQQKPMTQDQVQALVRDGFGDESGAKLIEQRGIDFVLTEDFLQSLKAAGARETFLSALRAAKLPEPVSAKKPLDQVQVILLLAGQVSSHRVVVLVNERGIDFDVTDDYLQEVRLGGGDDELITALKNAKVTKPVTVDPAAQVRQDEIRRHVARGAEFFQKSRYGDAEAEYRAAVRLDPQNADLHVALSRAMNDQTKPDEALAEAREALLLSPDNQAAHLALGEALYAKRKLREALAEYREALRLDPLCSDPHFDIGQVLEDEEDFKGALDEFTEALSQAEGSGYPKSDQYAGFCYRTRDYLEALHHRGLVCAKLGDFWNATFNLKMAVELDPDNAQIHFDYGQALDDRANKNTRDQESALAQYRIARDLDPKNLRYSAEFERLSRKLKH